MKLEDVVAKLNKIEGYKKQFQAIYKTDVTADGIAKALSAFERTILSVMRRMTASRRVTKRFSEQAQRGMKLFFGKANCWCVTPDTASAILRFTTSASGWKRRTRTWGGS